MNSLRLEKAYRHWGHDITEDDPLAAGLGFCVAWSKREFLGRDALLRQRGRHPHTPAGPARLQNDTKLLYHDEPIWRDGRIVGSATSGMFGHRSKPRSAWATCTTRVA